MKHLVKISTRVSGSVQQTGDLYGNIYGVQAEQG